MRTRIRSEFERFEQTMYRHRALLGNLIAFLGFALVAVDRNAKVSVLTLVIGAALGLLGFGLRVWAASYQWPNIARDLPAARTGLITAGPYAYLRHPIYLGLILLTAGVFVGLGSWATAAVVSACMVAFTAWQAYYEEAFLSQRYTEEVRAYRKHVPQFMPKLWDPYPVRKGEYSLPQGIKHDIGPLSAFSCFVLMMLVIAFRGIPSLQLTLSILVASIIFSFVLTWLVRAIFKREFGQ